MDDTYEDPLRWAFVGSGAVNRANTAAPVTHETERCTIKVLALHRPTHEPGRESTGDYPYAWHLAGRKRHFEIRVQFRFKQLPESPLHFGVVLNRYGQASRLGREATNILIAAIRRVVGDFYHSFGDDPAQVKGEAEPSTFVMPLWAFDQFVVSEPGYEPHLAGNLEGLGMRRTDGVAAYTAAMRSAIENLSTEKVYTFSFWSVSQFLDMINWEMVGGFLPFTRGSRFALAKAGAEPPINVVAYELLGASPEDRRHLPSRRRHYVNVIMWSQKQPPAPETLSALLGAGPEGQAADEAEGKEVGEGRPRLQPRGLGGRLARALAQPLSCCMVRGACR